MRAVQGKKQCVEHEIHELAGLFFSLPKADTASAVKRTTVKEKLWIKLWQYYKEIQYAGYEYSGEKTAEQYSDVINSSIAKAMNVFNPGRGVPFLHYVNAAVAQEIGREKQQNDLHGLKVPQKILRQWRLLARLAQSRNIAYSDIRKMQQLASLLGYSETELQQVLDFGKVKIISGTITRDDGKAGSVFDELESDMSNPEKEFEKKEVIETALHKFRIIDEIFQKKQERVKKYLSALLTLAFFPDIVTLNKIIGRKQKFAFVDLELYAELDSLESKGFSLPAQQEIATRFGRDKTDASRTLRTFLQEVP